MSSAVSPCIVHLDADAFFASLEQRDDPRLRGRPVAVGTGVVASCSYEARRYGVRTGMRLSEARRRCRVLRVVPGDYRRYEQAARRMLAICREQTPRVEASALDDLYLDLTNILAADPEQVAGTLAAQIRHEVGLGVSIGIGTSKFVARVATQQAKQNKCRMEDKSSLHSSFIIHHSSFLRVLAGGERAYLAPWSAAVLPGVGPRVLARLERLNVRRVGEVADVPLPVLCGLFGERGRRLRDLARGIDPRPVLPDRVQESVSRSTSFEPAASDREFVWAMLDHLLDRAASWLRWQRRAARGLKLVLRYGDYRSEEGHVSFRPATDDEVRLKEAAHDRLGRLWQRRLPLRLAGVELSPLQAPEGQAELFPDPAAERMRRLTACKDAVRHRFGFMALVSGSALRLAEELEHDRENFRLRTPCLTR
jgi:DNA polymerase-4